MLGGGGARGDSHRPQEREARAGPPWAFCASVSERHFVSTKPFAFEGKGQASGGTLIPVPASPSLKSEAAKGLSDTETQTQRMVWNQRQGCQGSPRASLRLQKGPQGLWDQREFSRLPLPALPSVSVEMEKHKSPSSV